MQVKGILSCVCLIMLFYQTIGYGEISIQEFKDDIIQSVQSRMLDDYPLLQKKDIDIIIAHEKTITFPKESISYDYDLSRVRSLLGKTVVPIILKNKGGEEIEQSQIILRVSAQVQFLKTNRKIRRGEPISSDHFDSVYEDLYGKPVNAIHSFEELDDKESRIIISKGVILTESMVKKKSVIYSGDEVSVLLVKDNLKLKVKGIAKEDGALGDRIRVKILLGKKRVLKGVIIDQNTIYITHSS